MSDQILHTLRSHKGFLASKYYVSAIALFGSYSRNEAGENSDVDIMVEFSQTPGLEFIDLALYLEKVLGLKVDLVSRNAIKPKYFAFIKKDLKYA